MFRPYQSNASTVLEKSSAWDAMRTLITRLYVKENKTLAEVRRILSQDHNHHASFKQYKTRIKQWGLDKNNKEPEVRAIVHLKRTRDAVGKASAFSIRGRPITEADCQRYFKRKGVMHPEHDVDQVDIITEAVRCWTPPLSKEQQLMDWSGNAPNHTNDMHHLPSWIARRNFEVPRTPSTPQVHLIPEKLLFSIKAYLEGSIHNKTFITDDSGTLINVSASTAPADLALFYDLCMTGGRMIENRSCLQGRRLLSKASTLVKSILQAEWPHTIEHVLGAIISLSDQKLTDVARNMLN